MLYTGGFFKNLQTSDTNGHFSEYVATRRTSSVSLKTVPLLLDADGTPTSFPGSLFFLGTRLIERLSRDRRDWKRLVCGLYSENGVDMLQVTTNSPINTPANEFL